MSDRFNRSSGLNEGIATGLQWANQAADLQLRREQTEMAKQRFDQEKLVFQSAYGQQLFNEYASIAASDDGPLKNERIKLFEDKVRKSGLPLNPTWGAAAKDKSFVMSLMDMQQALTGVQEKNPEAFQKMMAGVLGGFGTEASVSVIKERSKQLNDLIAMRQQAAIKEREAALKPQPNPFMETLQKEQAKEFAQEVQGIAGADRLVETVDRAFAALEKNKAENPAGTGPLASFAGFRPWFDSSYQNLQSLFSELEVKSLTELFRGMSQAVNSNVERAAFTATQPSITKDDKVNAQILLGAKSLALKKQAEARAKQDFVAQNGNLNGFRSPIIGAQTLIDPKTGEMRLFQATEVSKAKEQGFLPLDNFVNDAWAQSRVAKTVEAKRQRKQEEQAAQTAISQKFKDALEEARRQGPEALESLQRQIRTKYPDPNMRRRMGLPE